MTGLAELIRSYLKESDYEESFALWELTLGASWPLNQQVYDHVINTEYSRHLVATVDGHLAGLAAVSEDSPSKASIVAIVVHPDLQRRGIGSRLLSRAVDELRTAGVQDHKAGTGKVYFWPTYQPTCLVRWRSLRPMAGESTGCSRTWLLTWRKHTHPKESPPQLGRAGQCCD